MAANNLSILLFIPFSSPPSVLNHGWPGWPIEYRRTECMWSSRHFSFGLALLNDSVCGGWRKPSTMLWGHSNYTVERPWWRGTGAVPQQPGPTHPQSECVTLEAGPPTPVQPSKDYSPGCHHQTKTSWGRLSQNCSCHPSFPDPQKSGEIRNN